MKSKNFLNSVNLNAGSSFPYLVLDVVVNANMKL